MKATICLASLGCLLAAGTAAQVPQAAVNYPAPPREISLRSDKIHLSPGQRTNVIGNVLPGQDVVVLGTSGKYAHVFVHVSGWIRNRGLLPLNTPGGDRILLGAAINLERQAEAYAGEDKVAQNAARLFYRITDDFPGSPLTAEALYRAGRIEWQLHLSRYSTPKGTYNYMLRGRLLRKVINKYPHTPWAAKAAFLLLKKKMTCNDWIRKPSCIEKEGGVYRDYVHHFHAGPRTAEAMFQVAAHAAAAWWVYAQPGKKHDAGKSRSGMHRAEKWITRLQRQYPNSDWAAEAGYINYEMQHQLRPQGLGLKS